MGMIYAQSSLITIIGAFHKTGINKREIFAINRLIFRSKIEKHWENIAPTQENWSEKLIREEKGLYFLRRDVYEANKDLIPKWQKNLKESFLELFNVNYDCFVKP